MIDETQPVVTKASLSFLRPGSWPKGERPYELLYIPTDGTPLINYERLQVEDIPIYDMRPRQDDLSLDRDGFIVGNLRSKLDYEDFHDEELLKTVFADELRTYLQELLGARALFIHECVVRNS